MKKETHTSQGRELSIKEMAKEIEVTFKDFKVPIEIVEMTDGLKYFHFNIKPQKPTRMKVFKTFVDDLRYALSSDKVEIEAPIPDSKLVGIRVPKKADIKPLKWADAIKDKEFTNSEELVVPLGLDEFGRAHLINIAKMPHVLIAGTTGSGKSVLLHSFIASLMKKNTPEQVRFILIDPKRVELTLLSDNPFLLTPVITDAKKTILALKWLIKEMERRYDILQEKLVRDISVYHEHRKKNDEPMPYIVVVFDEISDIMAAYPNECEASLIRLAQMSRAVGIHFIISTQRPSVNVVTGMLKANIPTRIAGQVASQVDSRVVLDMTGAEKLDGMGDMLFLGGEMYRPIRLQTYMISEDEVVKGNKEAQKKYSDKFEGEGSLEPGDSADQFFATSFDEDDDDMYEEAKAAVIAAGKASTSFLQRKLRIGYSRTARLMDLLEERGVIGPADGSAPREVLIDEED